MQIIKEIPPKLPKNSFVALDIEMFGMNKKQLHRPISGEFAALTICPDPNTVFIIQDETLIPDVLANLEECVWVFQNAKFDLTQLRRYANISPRKRLWDTLLIDRILWNGYYNNFSLEDLARRYLDIYVDKSLQKSFADATEMSDEQIEYACKDASITLQIALEQKKIITKNDFKIWRDIDAPALWAITDFQGFPIDVDEWNGLAEKNKARYKAIDEKLPFNPHSPPQVLTYLKKTGFLNLKSTGKDPLEKAIRKYPDAEAVELAKKTLESRMYRKRSGTYGANFIKNFLEKDDGVPVIYPNILVNGAETSRMASRDPNIQNIPIRETPEFRKCFIARPGNELIVADYSAQEPRIMAYLSQDKRMIQIFQDRKTIYIEVADKVFDEQITKKDDRYRQMKDLVLGVGYGLSEYGLARQENISKKDAKFLLRSVHRFFPEASAWGEKQAQKKKLVTTVPGRKIWLNPYTWQAEKNARNSPVQGTAAEMLKLSIIRIHREWDFDCPFGIVAPIHDELILDVPRENASEIAFFVKKIMVEEAEKMCPGVPFIVDIVIADSWAGKA